MEEQQYKIILGTLILVASITRGYYEIRYLGFERIKAHYEGRERIFVGVVGLCMMLPALIFIFSHTLDFASFTLSDHIRLSGCILMMLNILFFFWIHYTLGRNWSPILEIFKDQSLITTGPYKFIRHPMYTSIFIHVFALLPVTANWAVGLVAILSFSIIYPFRVKSEEQMMIEQFGDRYKEYMKQTGRLLPRLF